MKLLLAALSLFLITAVYGHSASEWKSRVIYQLLTDRFAKDTDDSNACSDLSTYCGGTFKGIIQKLDYIQGLGANAIWISPIPLQTDGGYHGYWQQDITQINPNFGTEQDLKDLVNACHSKDIWVMLDVVANHVGNQNYNDWSNFAKFVPFNDQSHYHSYCLITDFTNQQQVEVCRLANLPDLDQSNSFVRSTLKNWVQSTIQKYGFDGIRIDTTPEVPKDFWSEYSGSAGVFSIGEVFNGDPNYVSQYQGPLNSVLSYPMYYKLSNAFQQKQTMRNIHDGVQANQKFSDSSVLGGFLDNHDNPRFLSQNSDWNTLQNALAYNIFAESIPIIYYGTEQGFNGPKDPNNRESLWPHYNTDHPLYKAISIMAKFRNSLGSQLYNAQQIERYVDDQFFAFSRGNVLVATTNLGSGQSFTRTITYHPYSDGTKLVNQLDTSDTVVVNNGQFQVNINNGLPKIYYPQSTEDVPLEEAVVSGHDEENKTHYTIGLVTGFASLIVVIVIVTLSAAAGVWYYRRRKNHRQYNAINSD
ncbi:PREDICTED: alpha-amylase-like [Amphimedon queenslandica]|uniref:alpha-amylase n=1 Tax=Amphimedon queenslandica TaxID=400682 RepID=A0A1X7UZA1_AMPQE|nr:PREDICTED: alpha-amylase-like [Amphimedon queenslandica]|eukprot:XP_019851448.1 PREDICTED: alpha-amylase-like [Amphimedon queenslandica]